MKHSVFVPAVTAVLYQPGNPRNVAIIRFATKHNGGNGLPGGRLDFEHEDTLTTVIRDCAKEECGLTVNEQDIRFLPLVERPQRDVREISGFKYVHGSDHGGDAALNDLKYSGHFMDVAVTCAPAYGHPHPTDTVEVAEVRFVNLDDALELPLALDFGRVLAAYAQILEQFPDPLTLPRPIRL